MVQPHQYKDVLVEIKGKIGIIKFNRAKALNSFGGNQGVDAIAALRELNDNPNTVFTVITGDGRFFSAGADVREGSLLDDPSLSAAQKKLLYVQKFMVGGELMRSIIDHKKVVVVALNGPGVGAGAAWIPPIADILLAADKAYLHVNFSSLGLVPENGSAITFAEHMGVQRANEITMFGRKMTVQELQQWGMVNKIFPTDGFHESVIKYLEDQLAVNDGKAMMESKRLQNAPRRDARMIAVMNAIDALAERFVDGEPYERFNATIKRLEAQSKERKSKL